MARQKDVEVGFAVPEEALVARADLTLVEQAVSNLVHNAVRYTPDGGHVAVLLDAAEAADSSADRGLDRDADRGFRLRVVDDGPGIAPEDLERLTQRDARADEARSRYPEGQGIGLHIARQVAERHGWTLELGPSEHGGLEAVLAGQLGDRSQAG